MTDEYEVADENQVKILVDKINALNNKAKKVIKVIWEKQEKINKYIKSDQPYTIRFGISMLMKHYLDDNFKIEYANKVAGVQSEEYYVNMMRAWYFATALAKQYDSIIPFIEKKKSRQSAVLLKKTEFR